MHGLQDAEYGSYADGSKRLAIPLLYGCLLEYVWNVDPRKADLAAHRFSRRVDMQRYGPFHVELPTMHVRHLVSLTRLLQHQGLGKIFDRNGQPFSGVSTGFHKGLDDVLQYTDLAIWEEGVSLHSDAIGASLMVVERPRRETATVDRTFWLRLTDRHGATMYLGRFDKPTTW